MNKLPPFIALVLFLLAPAALFAADPPAAAPATTPAALKPFTKSALTPAQLAACDAFKSKAGQPRIAEANALAGILVTRMKKEDLASGIAAIVMPEPIWLFTQEDIIDLLGKPASIDKAGSLTYFLGKQGDIGFVLHVEFENGHLRTLLTQALQD